MKLGIWIGIFFVMFTATALAEGDYGRYRFEPSQNVMIDTETGKVTWFDNINGQWKFIETDFVNGSGKAVKNISASEQDYVLRKKNAADDSSGKSMEHY